MLHAVKSLQPPGERGRPLGFRPGWHTGLALEPTSRASSPGSLVPSLPPSAPRAGQQAALGTHSDLRDQHRDLAAGDWSQGPTALHAPVSSCCSSKPLMCHTSHEASLACHRKAARPHPVLRLGCLWLPYQTVGSPGQGHSGPLYGGDQDVAQNCG